MQKWTNGETNLAIGGGESPEEVKLRQAPVWDLILSREEEKNVLVCIHGRALRILMCHVNNVPLNEMESFDHDNLCLYLLEYDGNLLEVKKTNCLLHLKEMKNMQ